MNTIKILVLVFIVSLVLFGCAKEETKMAGDKQPDVTQPGTSVGNASFLNEVADLMVQSTSNSTVNNES